jgi:hypothetical protein
MASDQSSTDTNQCPNSHCHDRAFSPGKKDKRRQAKTKEDLGRYAPILGFLAFKKIRRPIRPYA